MQNTWDIFEPNGTTFLKDATSAEDRTKRPLFNAIHGRVLVVATGTGRDVRHLRPSLQVTAIDISEAMLKKAALRCGSSGGTLRLLRADVILMFEHVRSSNPLSAAVLDLMTFVTRHWEPR